MVSHSLSNYNIMLKYAKKGLKNSKFVATMTNSRRSKQITNIYNSRLDLILLKLYQNFFSLEYCYKNIVLPNPYYQVHV